MNIKDEKRIKVAFIQRLLPLYRKGFYKELALVNDTYEFTIFCSQKEDKRTNIKTISFDEFKDNTNIKWVHTNTLFYRGSNILWQSNVVKNIILKKYKVVLLTNKMSHLFYWLVILLCKIRNIKIVFWSHGLQGNEKGFKLAVKKKYLQLADINLVYANYNKAYMIKEGFKDDRIFVIYNSLDLKEINTVLSLVSENDRDEIKKGIIKNNLPIVLFVSRLERKKKLSLLLKALSELKSRNVIVNLIIIGNGSELNNLKRLGTDLGIMDQLKFEGSIYKEQELAKYFYIADLFVSPGNVGLNCIHSLAYGVPVITHDDFRFQNPEVEAIKKNETGAFFRKDDATDLADKIEYWLSMHSKEGSFKLARARVQEIYSPENQAQSVLNGLNALFSGIK